MERLVEYIEGAFSDGILLESIGSDIVRNVFSTGRGGELDWLFSKGLIAREMQWDKMTDDDVEIMETEDARKLAYKKDSDAYIIWLDAKGKFQARTIGNYMVVMDRNLSNWVRNTVKSVSMASDKAMVVKEPEKFQTRDMQDERRKAKENALALMSDAEVAKKNLQRYKDLINQRKLQDIDFEDVVVRMKAVIDEYSDMVKSISANILTTTDYRKITRDFDGLEEDMQKLMSMFKQVLKTKEDYDRYDSNKFAGIISIYRERLLEATTRLEKNIDAFVTKYLS